MAGAATGEAPAASTADKAKKADTSHFGGPLGAAAFISLLPLLTLYLWLVVHTNGGALFLPSAATIDAIPVPTPRAALIIVGWVAFQALLEVILPGRVVTSIPQRDGLRMQYKLNGFLSLWVTLGALGALAWAGVVTGADVLAELGPLLTTAILASYVLAAFLYGYGFRSKRNEVRSDHLLYDYFMGTALNPRLGERFDLKLFFESKIAMTSWIVVTLAMAHAEYLREGTLSLPMALVCLFQLFYVADFYWFEDAMLSTWDINNENYGFMLAFAFLVWMPFTFSLQAQYLVYESPAVPVWAAPLLIALNFAGYYVFRSSNLQKHRFKTDPDARIWGKPPSFITTRRGTKLLTSGWWGLARHSNYFGDLTMALAWCLPCGFTHIVPYFYFIYFTPLLVDRERRDHRACQTKYGDDWTAYCDKVKYRIVPGLY